MFDSFAELGSSFSWVYRGWFYIFFSSYRESVKTEHAERSANWRRVDIVMSVLFMWLEVGLIYQIAR